MFKQCQLRKPVFEAAACALAALAMMLALAIATPSLAFADDASQGNQTGLTAGTIADTTTQQPQQSQQAVNPNAVTKPFKAKGTYFITLAKNSKKAIGMKGNKRVENTKLVVAKKKNTNLLRFKFSSAGKGLFYIKNEATGRLLTAEVNAKGTSGVVQMNAKYSTKKYLDDCQKWQVVVNADKTVTISHPRTGLRLSLAGGKTAKGTKLKLVKPNSEKNGLAIKYQRFTLKKTKKNKNEAVTLDVPCYWQNPQLPTGCESVALTNALRYWGFKLSKTAIASSWMPYGSNGVYNFIGSPYNSSGWIICAPGIERTANKYLDSKESDIRATNVSGTTLKGLRKYLDKGYPVVVWTTMYMGSPWNYDGSRYAEGHRYPFYHNNHAVVLTGYNPKTGRYRVADSLSGKVWRDGGSFGSIYKTMGRQAVVIHDDGIDI